MKLAFFSFLLLNVLALSAAELQRKPTIGKAQPAFSVTISFSNQPKDEELQLTTVFSDRLVPMSIPSSEGENLDLSAAVVLFQNRSDHEDLTALQAFIQKHPASRWNASLLLNMGLERYDTGYLSEALQLWRGAWDLAKHESGLMQRAIADRAIGELLVLNARVGRVEVIEQLLAELGERPVEGAVAAKVQAAKEGLTLMKLEPGVAFKCGPFALNSIINFRDKTPHDRKTELEAARSTPQGTNLLMLKEWAQAVGLDYQVVKKEVTGQMVYPAVIHWKLDHFAALLAFKDGRYLVQDATFGGTEMWVTAKALEAETDGYYLIPAGRLPNGWRQVQDDEAVTVWGKGGAAAEDKNAKRSCPLNSKGNPECLTEGMPVANYYLMQATSNIQDVPLYYQPPVGPQMVFLMNYNHDETANAAEINTHSTLGPNWDFNWVGFLEVDNSNNVMVRLRDGGTEVFHFSLFDNITNAYPPDLYSQAILKWTTDAGGKQHYRRELRDGSVEVYSQPGQPGTVGRYYLKEVIDPQGNTVTINYEVYSGSKIIYSEELTPGQNTIPGTKPKWTGRINEIRDAAGGITFIRYMSDIPTKPGFRKIKRIVDPYGREVLFTYDGAVASPGRINSIKDAVGMISSFQYAADGFIETMTTPYGKTQFHRYNRPGTFEYINIDDLGASGPVSVNEMMRGLKITYPNGSSTVVERWIGHRMQTFHWNRLLMSRYPLDVLKGDPDKYEHSEVYRWLLSPGSNEMTAIPSHIDRPLAGRTEFGYKEASTKTTTIGEDQTVTHYYSGSTNQPSLVSKDGRSSTALYSLMGNLVATKDALNRTTKYYYDGKGVDLLEVRQLNGTEEDLLMKVHYNQRHLPEKIYDEAGQLWENTYNQYGQVLTSTDPLGKVTTYTYETPLGDTNPDAHDSRLASINGPLAGDEDVTTFTYDEVQRLESVTDSEGYTTWYEYDELNRIVKVTYQPEGVALSDAEYEEVIYDRLDAVLIRDRQGRLTQRQYNEMGWLVSETDSEGRTLEFEWCTCGSLAKLQDANGNVTRWEYDDLGRISKKIRANGREEEYAYYPHDYRLQYVTVAGDVRKELFYNPDDSISQIAYYIRERDGSGNPITENGQPKFMLDAKTPSVWLGYDPVYSRLKEIRKSPTEASISYEYHPFRTNPQAATILGAGSLSQVNEHDLNAAIRYTYDALGRIEGRSIWSVVDDELVDDNHPVSVGYDAMGRVTEMTDVLGTFLYEYEQATKGLSRLSKITYPNGQETLYRWQTAAQHHRLDKITHQKSTETLISEYGYGYGFGGQLRRWTQKVGAAPQQDWIVEHDDADQLRSVVVREGSSIVRQQYYNYDAGGNRVSYQDGHSVMKFGHNSMNQINARPAGGLVRFEGTLDEPGTVSINGQAAQMRTVLDETEAPEFRFSLDLPLGEGTNAVAVTGRDGSSNETTQNYEVAVSGLAGQAVPSYDVKGNMLSNGRGQDYEWDALNRLVAINYEDESRSEFTYDALSRRVKEVEKDEEGEVVGEKQLLWEGTEIVQERTAEGEVAKRYANQGVALSDDSKYYFTRDHLGSVRQVSDEVEQVVESYSYDAYGLQVASATGGPGGMRLADFRYTGHRFHEQSGLHLAPYRAYHADLGTWISEDPIEEEDDINLYAYVANQPDFDVDLLGLSRRGGLPRGVGGARMLPHQVWRQNWTRRQSTPRTGGQIPITSPGCRRSTGLDQHHPIPKFLGGGANNQPLLPLPNGQHRDFHSLLRRNMDSEFARKNPPVGGAGGSAANWAKFFQNNPGSQNRALGTLLNTCRQFDQANGTQTVQSTWQNLFHQLYTPYP